MLFVAVLLAASKHALAESDAGGVGVLPRAERHLAAASARLRDQRGRLERADRRLGSPRPQRPSLLGRAEIPPRHSRPSRARPASSRAQRPSMRPRRASSRTRRPHPDRAMQQALAVTQDLLREATLGDAEAARVDADVRAKDRIYKRELQDRRAKRAHAEGRRDAHGQSLLESEEPAVPIPRSWVEAAGYPSDPSAHAAYADLDQAERMYGKLHALWNKGNQHLTKELADLKNFTAAEKQAAKAYSFLEQGEPGSFADLDAKLKVLQEQANEEMAKLAADSDTSSLRRQA